MIALVITLFSKPLTASTEEPIFFEFNNIFPYKVCISTWKENSEIANGFRYKIYSRYLRIREILDIRIFRQNREKIETGGKG